jgi:two-component system sensor histidine kinase UhpB
MSLRVRLLAAIFLALLISFSLGAGLAAWRAARTTRDELAASLSNARQSTLAALADLPGGRAAEPELRRIVGAFDGSRHMRAALIDGTGAVTDTSHPADAKPPPGWFLHLVSPSLKTVVAPVSGVPGVAALRLQADPVSEAGERWAELRERLASFALFFVLAAVLCSFTVARSLRPLTSLAQGLNRLGRGETEAVVAEQGPPEIATLARAFNAMTAALHAAEAQNRRLSQQVLRIAEEERADIARDLHDEIGPLLFAITTFTAAIGRQVETGELAQVPAQLRSIQDATARLQQEVRDMLSRLHDGSQAPADLRLSLTELLAFWRSVRPETGFHLDAAGGTDEISDAVRECLYRAAQEGVSNAVRHGHPRNVTVHLATHSGNAVLTVRDDGGGGPENAGRGLPGMRSRAASLGGSVDVSRSAGWTVTVRVPLDAQAVAAANAEAVPS